MKTNLSSQIKLDRIPKGIMLLMVSWNLRLLHETRKFTPKSSKALRKGRCM